MLILTLSRVYFIAIDAKQVEFIVAITLFWVPPFGGYLIFNFARAVAPALDLPNDKEIQQYIGWNDAVSCVCVTYACLGIYRLKEIK